MMKSVNVHSTDPIPAILEPVSLSGSIHIQLILFSVASEQLSLCDDIIAVVGHILIFFFKIVLLRSLLVIITFVIWCTTGSSMILDWCRPLILLLPLRPSEIMIRLSPPVRFGVIIWEPRPNGAEMLILWGSVVGICRVMQRLSRRLSPTLGGRRTCPMVT